MNDEMMKIKNRKTYLIVPSAHDRKSGFLKTNLFRASDQPTIPSQPVHFNVEQDSKGEQYVTYKPPKFGMYNVAVNFGGMPLPNSPYKVKISPKVDASKVKIAGLGRYTIVYTLYMIMIIMYNVFYT